MKQAVLGKITEADILKKLSNEALPEIVADENETANGK